MRAAAGGGGGSRLRHGAGDPPGGYPEIIRPTPCLRVAAVRASNWNTDRALRAIMSVKADYEEGMASRSDFSPNGARALGKTTRMISFPT